MNESLTPAQLRVRDMKELLRWEGEIGNSRLREVFDVQSVQASRVLDGVRRYLWIAMTKRMWKR